jgi:hypothetical protein
MIKEWNVADNHSSTIRRSSPKFNVGSEVMLQTNMFAWLLADDLMLKP